MSSPHLGRLLLLNRGIQLPRTNQTPSEPGRVRRLPHLVTAKPVSLGPVRALLAEDERTALRSAGARGTAVLWAGGFLVTVVLTLAFFVSGVQRVHYVRETYQLSTQLKQRERELHQVQRAYHALEAFVAVQGARDARVSEARSIAAVAPTPKRTTRS